MLVQRLTVDGQQQVQQVQLHTVLVMKHKHQQTAQVEQLRELQVVQAHIQQL